MPGRRALRKRAARAPARELVITRVFNAPRAKVFRAWTGAEGIKRWWGPKGFTTPFCKVDLRPGGAFHYSMRSPEGRDYWGKGIYREIIEPERIVFIDAFSDEAGNIIPPSRYGMAPGWPEEAIVTAEFAEKDGMTSLTLRTGVPEDLAERAGARQGWMESLDKLAAYLSKG